MLSPAVVLEIGLSEVAGNSVRRRNLFKEKVEAFHIRWRESFQEKERAGEMLISSDVRGLPAFVNRAQAPSTAYSFKGMAAVWGLSVMLLFAAVSGLRRRVGR